MRKISFDEFLEMAADTAKKLKINHALFQYCLYIETQKEIASLSDEYTDHHIKLWYSNKIRDYLLSKATGKIRSLLLEKLDPIFHLTFPVEQRVMAKLIALPGKVLNVHAKAVEQCFEEVNDIKIRFGEGSINKIILKICPIELKRIFDLSKISKADFNLN